MKANPDTHVNIQSIMNGIKGRSVSGIYTNYFQQKFHGDNLYRISTDKSILILNDEFDFYRLYYYTCDLCDLAFLVQNMDFSGTIVVNLLSKTDDHHIKSIFESSGFGFFAKFRRMASQKLRICATNSSLQFAELGEVEKVQQALLGEFNRYTGHIPTLGSLAEMVSDKQVLVSRRGSELSGCLVFQVHGRKVHYNFLYSHADDRAVAPMLIENFYGLMHERGISSGFLWVDELNTGVIRMHRYFGWSFDGLMASYYIHHANNQ